MNAQKLTEIMEDALKDVGSIDKVSKYADAFEEYLKKNKTTSELVKIVIKGMDIDRGLNYFDHLECVSANDIQGVWKKIGKGVKESQDKNSLKLLFGMLYMSVIRSGSLEYIIGDIISAGNVNKCAVEIYPKFSELTSHSSTGVVTVHSGLGICQSRRKALCINFDKFSSLNTICLAG